MKYKINTQITTEESGSQTIEKNAVNEVEGSDADTNAFKVDNVNSKSLKIDESIASAWTTSSVFNLVNADRTKSTAIHIQFRDNDLDTVSQNDFNLTLQIGTVTMDCAQFDLVNADNISGDIEITTLTVPTGREGILTIVITEKD